MVFSSHLFIFYFLPLALLLYYAMPQRGRNLLLTLVSYVFYGWANPLFVVLMLVSTTFDYVCGLFISNQFSRHAWEEPVPLLTPGGARTRAQRIALMVTLTSNLSLLGFFKYFNFATESWTALMTTLGLPDLGFDLAFKITLPLGISFYTFHSMSYAIDVYRGDARAHPQLRRFCLLRRDVPTTRRRPDPPLRRSRRATATARAHADAASRAASRFSASAWRRRSCWPIRAARSPTRSSTPPRRPASTRGTAWSPTRSRFTSISAATPTWRLASL